ncbi:restriction endonuclease subunit S [Vibrio parahaemolyticus]|uniref:Restriction endonuclease n=1 Tax=Vibrio parahaemolyticus TaxID=670 RepID=A0AAW3IQS3_VIBPH|nr:restriction endonuclease subunit S [Vibrio parahaemolyticus]KON58733.1 restriction endonuclease [Vibrio parahaemolyticus]KOY24331.1 restriction endonuclease [Vibrio parahaemolyticus]KZW12404.1 restriction endonuclease [Vibrio parahaemolyticus]KZW13053.1 restriction endonuclease [Vibrio parahaemolyticus]KZW16036.1 restriction endonuclease [Vibrio parahaemolyticus]
MSWPLVKLGEVAPSKALKNPVVLSDDNVWQLNLDMVESNSGRIINKLKAPLSEAGSSTHWFDERHVLYSKLRPYLNKVVLPDEQGLATTELVPMLPDPEKLDRRYLVHYLRSKQFVSWISDQVAGAKMPRVSMKIFWDHEIPLPPLAEQKRIAAILDKADAIRQKRKQAIELADEFLRSVFLDMFGDPVTNPKGWEVGTIRDLVSSVNYGSSAKASETDGEFPILRMGNITYEGKWNFTDLKYIDLNDKDQIKYLAHRNDLLFNRTNSKELVGKTAVFDEDDPMAIAGYLIRVRTNDNGNPWYISGYLNSFHGKQTLLNMCKSIVGMANINAQELQDIKIMLPPIELQNRYESIVKAVKTRSIKQNNSFLDLDNLFDSLSQKAFTGQL